MYKDNASFDAFLLKGLGCIAKIIEDGEVGFVSRGDATVLDLKPVIPLLETTTLLEL